MRPLNDLIIELAKAKAEEFCSSVDLYNTTDFDWEDCAQGEAKRMRNQGYAYQTYWNQLQTLKEKHRVSSAVVKDCRLLARTIYSQIREHQGQLLTELATEGAEDHEAERKENERLYKGG